MTTYQHLVGGEWVSSSRTSQNVNPSDTNDIVGDFAEADGEIAHAAIQAARDAFPAWSRSSPQQRFDVLDAAGNTILARKEELGMLLAREEGKILPEAIGEVVRAGQIFKFFAAEALRVGGEIVPSVRPGMTVEVTREAVGVIGMITPWNFPIAIPAWKIAPALAFGNTVVLKPAELVPGCAWEIAKILHEGKLPPGVFNLVMGKGSVVGETLVSSKHVDAISFTGSVKTGRAIGARCFESGKKFQLEMGGKNPMVVLDDADLDNAIASTLNGSFFSTGQRCTASSRLIVTAGIYDKFIEGLIAQMRALRVGHALEKSSQMGPVVDKRQLDQNQMYLQIAKDDGAQIFGGELLDLPTPGFYMAPALAVDTNNAMRINREEVFGPVASVVKAANYEEALALANDTEFGLSAGICTTSLKYAAHFKRNAEAGMIMVNAPTAGVDYHVPFGGRKGSSYGPREQGSYAREFYTTVKTTYINPL